MKLLMILIIFLLLFFIGFIIQITFFRIKKQSFKKRGYLVNVFNGRMHLTKMGNGLKTIILLPGLGVSLPSIDFLPLMKKLSEKYTVVTIEYFGVGYSSITNRDRNCENIVEEIRASLKSIGIKPPYYLMPHSNSSIYAEYYATIYPQEVKSIFSLDGTSSAKKINNVGIFDKIRIGYFKHLQWCGILSIRSYIFSNKKILQKYGLSKQEINNLKSFNGFLYNNNYIEQVYNIPKSIDIVRSMNFPVERVLYYKAISSELFEKKSKSKTYSSHDYQIEHLKKVNAGNSFKVLKGSHFIYYNNVDKIAQLFDSFLEEKKVQEIVIN